MQRLERSETVHGFRSSFRTWAAEQTNYPRDVWERALAHIVGNRTERAYERTDLFDKRRKLMESWSKYVTSPPAKPGAVIPIRKGR
jgi:integrase